MNGTYDYIKNAMSLFCRMQDTRTKEEAFLKGLYFGLGGERTRPRPNWELIKKNPELMIPIEQDINDLYINVMEEQIKSVEQLFKELYENEGRPLPLWLKK